MFPRAPSPAGPAADAEETAFGFRDSVNFDGEFTDSEDEAEIMALAKPAAPPESPGTRFNSPAFFSEPGGTTTAMKVKVLRSELLAAFVDADIDGNGSIGFDEIEAIEKRFGLPMQISAAAAQWADSKIDCAEFTAMLEANGNLDPLDEVASAPGVSAADVRAGLSPYAQPTEDETAFGFGDDDFSDSESEPEDPGPVVTTANVGASGAGSLPAVADIRSEFPEGSTELPSFETCRTLEAFAQDLSRAIVASTVARAAALQAGTGILECALDEFVEVKAYGAGRVRFVGQWGPGLAGLGYGIELFKATGHSNGTHLKKAYFRTSPNQAAFVPAADVVPMKCSGTGAR